MSSTEQTNEPYFVSKHIPDDAKKLNAEYIQYLGAREHDRKAWENYQSKRNDCMNKASQTPNMVERMRQFDECPKSKPPPNILKPDEFFYQRYSGYWRKDNRVFENAVEQHGLFDAYFLANEEYANFRTNHELCKQRGKLVSFNDLLKCIENTNKKIDYFIL